MQYKGKYFSVQNDSISTLKKFTEPCEAAFYRNDNGREAVREFPLKSHY